MTPPDLSVERVFCKRFMVVVLWHGSAVMDRAVPAPNSRPVASHFFTTVASERHGQSSNLALSFAWVGSAETDREMNNGEQRDIQENPFRSVNLENIWTPAHPA